MSTPFKTSRIWTIAGILAALALLAVVAAILLFPAANTDSWPMAKRAQAKNDAIQLAHAIQNYVTEYGKLPASGPGNVNTAELLNRLAGLIPGDPENPREVVFLEVPRARDHRNGAEFDGKIFTSGYKDSWGNDYEIRVDNEGRGLAYDNRVVGPAGVVVQRPVLVWSRRNPDQPDAYNDPVKWVKSWE